MLRTALRPRWLALLALALVLATGMAGLGQWQLDRAREQGRVKEIRSAASRPAVELTSLLAPRQSFTNAAADRPVTATGVWDRENQLLVAGRHLDGRRGWWVLTPLVLPGAGAATSGAATSGAATSGAATSGPAASGAAASGAATPGAATSGAATSGAATTSAPAAVAVVRGWVHAPSDAAADPGALPAGTVRIGGVLRPSEPPVDREPGEGSGLPEGQIDGVDLTQLVQRWPQRLVTGYVVLSSQDPAPATAPVLVPPTAPSNRSVAWQNLSYAVQWFVFAGFGLFMWWRLVRDDHLGRLRRPPGSSTPQPAPDPGVKA